LELARRILRDLSTKFSSPVCLLFFGKKVIAVRDWTEGSNSRGLRRYIGPKETSRKNILLTYLPGSVEKDIFKNTVWGRWVRPACVRALSSTKFNST